MNKTGLQDNYMGPFDVVACSEKYFTIKLNNGRIDNVTVERVNPCFCESDAIQQAAPEQYHEVILPAPPAPAAAAEPKFCRMSYDRVVRRPSCFMFHINEDSDDYS